ncbi:MAG: FG-GAP-like repeat-containing protein [Myxococcota bacterium]
MGRLWCCRLSSLLLLTGVVGGATPALALTADEATTPATRGFEQLPTLKAIRGAKTPRKYVQVTADAAEAWTASAEGAFVTVSPTTEQTGPLKVQVTVATESLTGNGPFDGAVVITPTAGGEAVRIPVHVEVWPPDVADLTADELKNRAVWPSDDGFGGSWELFGFLPDETSHPGNNAGVNMRAEEKTACTGGNTTNCTRPGQAGLASGQSADRAWLLSRGDPRSMVAVLDSGIHWDDRNLSEKAYLNARELAACPPPGASVADPASYDVNGDGVFNIRDYDWADPPYADWNGRNGLDPQDLIHGTNPSTNAPCSDDVDDDQNGYVDDISGWDFFWNDNDPSDDTRYGHGTGEANDSVGQGNDNNGGIGVCPRCTLLNVRVGDSFIADVNQFAEGVIFSVDSGASVVQEALGTLNATPFMRQAIDYAWNNGVLVVGSAADETSVHHNMPANAEHLINVHAITYDSDGQPGRWYAATTFLNFNNCTNYGAHLQLSTPGTGCSSEATGKTSGQAGLLYSYYFQLQDSGDPYYTQPLAAGEAFQVLIASADDIDVTGAEKDPEALQLKKYISNEGWDEAFGYGRNNARASLEMLRDKRIPPMVDITAPLFFEQFDPAVTPSLEVKGTVKVPRDDAADWVLEVAKGVAPKDSEFVQVSNGQATRAQAFDGTFGTLDLTTFFPDAQTPARDRDARTITIRVRATVTRGGETIRGEYRKAFSILRDPQRRRALALYLGASGESSPKITDLDGDGKEELVLGLADGTVHAFRGDGSELPSWPVRTNRYGSLSDEICNASEPALKRKCHRASAAYTSGAIDPASVYASVVATLAVGDLNGDGSAERDVVVATMDGLVFAYNASGQVLSGFPVAMDPAHVSEFLWAKQDPTENRSAELGFFASPVLVDLDADGDLEIVAAGLDQWVYAWNHDGSAVNGWPVHAANEVVPLGRDGRFDERIIATPTVADLDGDGKPEIVVGTGEKIDNSNGAYLYAIKGQGNAAAGGPFMPGWPTTLAGFVNDVLPYVGKGMPNTAAAADFDGDGKDEIVNAAMGGPLNKLDGEGREFGAVPAMQQASEYFGENKNTDELLVAGLINNPTIADLNMDGVLDIIDGTAGLGLAGAADSGGLRIPFQHNVSAWDSDNGYFLSGFPQVVEDFQFFMNYAVGDLDGDELPETISGSGVYFVHAFNHEGKEPEGWPKNTMGWVITTPALGDLDGDNRMEVATATREGWLFVWDMPGRVEKKSADEVGPIQWKSFHHDDHNSGNVGTDLGLKVNMVDEPGDTNPGPCGCAVAGDDEAPAGMALAAALLAVLARRRRS